MLQNSGLGRALGRWQLQAANSKDGDPRGSLDNGLSYMMGLVSFSGTMCSAGSPSLLTMHTLRFSLDDDEHYFRFSE